MKFKIGDKLQWDLGGKDDPFGTVVRVDSPQKNTFTVLWDDKSTVVYIGDDCNLMKIYPPIWYKDFEDKIKDRMGI